LWNGKEKKGERERERERERIKGFTDWVCFQIGSASSCPQARSVNYVPNLIILPVIAYGTSGAVELLPKLLLMKNGQGTIILTIILINSHHNSRV